EAPIGVERMMRDLRINLIFEGSSEIMHLFMAREAVDKHLEVAGALIDPRRGAAEKRAALPGVAAFYARWYPMLWLRGLAAPGRFGEFGTLARHLRFVERSARRLARASFHGMLLYRARMERKQAFLFRSVDIVMELFAMAAAVAHAARLADGRYPEAERARELADLFCRGAERKVRRLFADLWRHHDGLKNQVAASVMEGAHAWLERGILPLDLPPAAFRPRPYTASAPATETERVPAARG
ncbi:MAG TPA: acyl-CoA dehydrogenase, partial [Methylomirabilota bacterium]